MLKQQIILQKLLNAILIYKNWILAKITLNHQVLQLLQKLHKKLLHLKNYSLEIYIYNHINSAASDDIAAVISCNTNLQEFDIGSNNLEASGIITIASSLQKISTVTKLFLHDNNITNEAVDDTAGALLCNTKLKELDISGNNIQVTGMIKIGHAVQKICSLQKLARKAGLGRRGDS